MRRRWLVGIFVVSGVWAVLVAFFSSDSVHRLWGVMAACGYALALLAVLVVRSARASDVAIGLSFVGALLAPLTWMAAKGLEQPEVWVVARSGSMLLHQGTPYASAAALAATQNPNAYNPYLPVMALFGLPRALFDLGLLTDPRIWFGAVFLIVFWLALRQAGALHPGRWTILVAGSPVIAFELGVGGTDVPMVGFLCLGFALLYHRRPPTSVTLAVLAGLALGVASAMKATAWPALVVAVVLIRVRDGKRAAWAFAGTAVGVVVVCVGPFFVMHPKSLIDNTIKFPLGLASVRSQASSPLLGHIIASTWHSAGNKVVVGLLVLAAVAVGLSLVFRPPRSVSRAVVLLAGAMTLMFLLAPSTRFGYFIYPAMLAIWLFAVRGGAVEEVSGVDGVEEDTDSAAIQDPDEPPASSHTTEPTIGVERPAG
jgi:Glycosyltransferase family 87